LADLKELKEESADPACDGEGRRELEYLLLGAATHAWSWLAFACATGR